MAQYDGSIRIRTGIDTKGFDEDGKKLESKAKNLAKNISNSADVELNIDTSAAEKDVENFFDEEEKRIEELAKRAVERAKGSQTVSVLEEPRYGAPLTDSSYNKDAIKFVNEYSNSLEKTDEHLNQLKIDVEEYAKSLKDLQSQGKFFGDEEYDKVYVAWKNATDAVKAYQAELNKKTESGQAKIAEQEAKAAEKRESAQRRAEEQAEKALQKENERIQKQAENEAKLAAKEAERQAKIQAEAAEEQRLAQIRENAVAGKQRIIQSIKQIKQLEQEIADLKKAGVTEGYKDYDDRIQKLSQLKQEVKDYNANIGQTKENYKKLSDTAKKSFERINKSTQKTGGLMKTFATRLKGIALSLLVFNWITKAFNAVVKSIKEGFSNLYNDSNMKAFKNSVDSLKASALTLKNSFAAAFRPIVDVAIPYIQKLIDYMIQLMNVVGQFMAAITGQQKYTKAIKQTTAAIKDQNKAQNKQLSNLDNLNNITSDIGAGADGGAGTMFEEAPINSKILDFLQNIKDLLRPAIDYAQKLKDIFSQGFFDGLGVWDYRWKSIKDSIQSIKDSLKDIFTDSGVLMAADKWAQSVAYMLGSLAGSMTSIGLTIATNLIGGLSKYLSQNKERIKGYLISMFDIWTDVNYMFADLFQSIAYVFEAFASEQGQQLTANIIGIFTNAFMGITELASKLFRDIASIIIQPFVDNKEAFRIALEGFLGVLAEVTGTIKQGIDDTFDKLNEVYDEHFKPFFDSIANGLSDTVGKFLEFWNGSVQPILDDWAKSFDTLWKEHIQPMLNNFIELFGDAADFLKAIWENILKPWIDWIIKNILPVILPVIDTIVKQVFILLGVISDVVKGIISVIRGIIQFLTGVFTGDWKKAWEGVAKIFDGIAQQIKGIINGMLGIIKGFIDKVKEGIQVAKSFFGFGKTTSAFGENNNSKSSTFSTRAASTPYAANPAFATLSTTPIPKLATGAVIPANREFLAVLGDQKRGTNVEAPLEMIKQANKEGFLEVLNQLGLSSGGRGQEINLNLTVECEGYKLLQLIQKLDTEFFKQNSKHAFT